MELLRFYKIDKKRQILYSLLFIAAVFGVCFFTYTLLDYKVIGFILLLAISLIAISFDIIPVLICAFLTALGWNFFFIPPRFTFHIGNTDDVVLFTMYFVVALINGVLMFKIRQYERISRRREDRANTLKLYDTLLNSLSHELRTPIATIIGATDMLQMQGDKISEFDKGELLYEISRASVRLNHQVENLLNMSRLQSGFLKPNMQWCDINEVVYMAMKTIEEDRPSQQIHININPDLPLFRLDKGMLEQVIYNLLNNACRHTPPNSNVQVMALHHGSSLRIVVEDDGPGFPEDEIERVFDKFYRLQNSSAGGTGLGLSIVKGFIEAMNGSITLKNLHPCGCRFSIDFKPAVTHTNKKREPWLIRKY